MDALMRGLWVLFVAFVVSLLVFVAIGEFLTIERNDDLDFVAGILGVVAMADLGLGFVLRRNALETAREVLRTHRDDTAAMEKWRGGHFLGFVFAESVGLFGLAARLVTGSRELALPFFILSMAALILWHPTRPDS